MSVSADGWIRARLRIDDPEARGALAGTLAELLGRAVEETAEAVLVYLPGKEATRELDLVRSEGERVGASLETEPVASEDWAATWRAGLEPRRIGRGIVVAPTWTEPDPEHGDIVVRIDPQMAFGTGEHATTRGCLRLMEGRVRTGARVLDVGSGSGVLAIAAALLGAESVVAVEHDADANLNARENVERNGVADRVDLVEVAADSDVLAGLGRFDLIAANILSSVIIPLLPDLERALRKGGTLIVSGILASEAGGIVRAAAKAGLRPAAVDEEEEWWSGALERR